MILFWVFASCDLRSTHKGGRSNVGIPAGIFLWSFYDLPALAVGRALQSWLGSSGGGAWSAACCFALLPDSAFHQHVAVADLAVGRFQPKPAGVAGGDCRYPGGTAH